MSKSAIADEAVRKHGFRHFSDLIGVADDDDIVLLASGPSVNEVDIPNNKPIFGVNQAWRYFPGSSGAPPVDFWFSKDREQCADAIGGELTNMVERVIVPVEHMVFYQSRQPEDFRCSQRVYVPWKYHGGTITSLYYAQAGLQGNTTSVIPAIHAAALMGYRKIYLYGVDLGWRKGQGLHFYDEPGPDSMIPINEAAKPGDVVTSNSMKNMLRDFQNTATSLKKLGVEVIDCSPWGLLTCFPKGECSD